MTPGLLPIFFTVFLLASGISFVAPITPLLIKSMGASEAIIGQIQTVYFLAFTVTTFLLGRCIDKTGSKRLIITGLFIVGTAVVLMPFASDISMFYWLRIVHGIGSAFLFAPTEAAINIISPPEKRSTNMGIYGFVFAFGFVVGPVVGATLYAIKPEFPFLLCTSSCLVAVLVLLVGFKETPVSIKKNNQAGALQLIKTLKIPLTASLCYAFIEVSLVSFLSIYLYQLEITGASLGIVFTAFAIGGTVSPYPAGRLADRFGKKAMLKACSLLLIVVTLLFSFYNSLWMICLLIFMVGLVAGALYPVGLALIADMVPAEKVGSATASFSIAFGVGSIIAPFVTGWVLELTSFSYLFYPMTVSAVILFLILMTERTRKIVQDS